MSGSRRVTSADVAREAGVSRTTVSYVLNNTPHRPIPEVTRARVLESARRLGYAPSAAARALRRGRSDIVLFVNPAWPIGHTIGQTLERVTATFADNGLIMVAHEKTLTTRTLSEVWRSLMPAAIIAFEPFDEAEAAQLQAAGIEVVLITLDGADAGEGDFAVPNESVGRAQVDHLVDRGHTRIAFVDSPDPRVRRFSTGRLKGVHDRCLELGLEPPVARTVDMDDVPAAVAALDDLLSGADPTTAVCAYNDEVAFAVLATAAHLRARVPEDLAVIGVDDIPTARFAIPPLSTVANDAELTAAAITAPVIRALVDPTWPQPDMTGLVIVVPRAST